MDRASDSPMSVADLSSIRPLTVETSGDSDVTTDISLAVPSMDACDIPLPDEECDWDLLEISALDDHPGSDIVEVAYSEPTEADNTIRDQDDTQANDINHHDTSLTSASSTPSPPETPRKQDGSQTDDGDLHGSSITPMSSIDSSPKTPAEDQSLSHPSLVEDSGPGFSLDDLDLSSPNWMDKINQFLETLGDVEPEKSSSEKDGKYDGPVIAIPDTPDYHPYSENFQICLSKHGGFGTFAIRDLRIGEVILIEKPLLRTARDSFYADFLKLSGEDQETFMRLYTPPGNYKSRDGSDYNHIRAIVAANSFAIPPYVNNNIISVYNVASRLNHACQPVANVFYDFDGQNPNPIRMTTSKVVKAGSELFISYGGHPMSLYERYGFRCCCGGCEGVTDQDLAIKKKREMNGWN
ncbi:hypothetical protein QBC32DRAFT_326250 [Pseudoneurospora amorphoporcata]|uniref:SET domain-containing protein n=1 Tax=Pseudoneurospora amorphoporcata TaxID=241081 RepID=A0AAN6NQR2_9PEZI|nr:hypothetical protein QBC32DRAFT_326250 [Pseudoneurospora amorphoporcata]